MLKARLTDRPPAKKNDTRKNTKKISFNKFNLSSFKKSIFYIFISIFVLLFGLSFIAPMFVNLKVWKPEIISIIDEYTSKKTIINGDINFRLYPYPQIITENIIIYDDIDNNEQFFSSDIIKAKVSLWPLITGNIEIDKIIIENINLNIINYKNNEPNWVFNNLQNNSNEDGFPNISENFSLPKIEIKQYEFINGKVSVLNNGKVYNIEIDNVIFDTSNAYNSLIGELNIGNIDFSVSGNLNNVDGYENISLSIFNDDLKLFLDGEIQYKNFYPKYNGTFKVDLKDIKDIATKLDKKYLVFLDKKTKFESNLDLSFQNKDLFYVLDNISISSGSAILTGAISGNNGDNSILDIVLSSNNFNLDGIYNNLNKYLDIINNTENNDSDEINDLDIDVSLLLTIGTSKLLDYPIRDLVIDIEKNKDIYRLNKASGTFPGNTQISFEGDIIDDFKVFNGNSKLISDDIKSFGSWLSFDFGNLSSSRFKKTEISSSVVIRKGGATFAGLNAVIDSSKINGEVRLRFLDENNLSANLKIDQINIDGYLDSKSNEIEKSRDYDAIDKLDQLVLDLQIDKVIYESETIEGINFSSTYSNNDLSIRKLELANYKKGALVLNGEINNYNSKPIYDLSFNYENNDFSLITEMLKKSDIIKYIIVDKGVLEGKVTGEKNSLSSQLKFDNKNIEINYNGNINFLSSYEIIWDGSVDGKIKNINNLINIDSSKNIEDNHTIYDYSASIFLDKNTFKLDDIDFKNNKNFYNGKFEIDFEDIVNIEADIYTNSLSFPNFIGFNNFITVNFSKDFLGKFKITADEMHVFNNVIEDLSGLVSVKDDEIIFKDFKGKVFNTKISSSTFYDKNDNTLEMEIKISKGDINLLFDNYIKNNAMFGQFSTKFLFTSEGESFSEISNNLKGNGQVKLRNIYIENIDLINSLNFLQTITNIQESENSINDSLKTGNNTIIDNVDFELTFNNNIFNIKDMTVGIEDYYGYLNTEYDLYNNGLNGKFKFSDSSSNTNELLMNLNSLDNIVSYKIDILNLQEDLLVNKNKINDNIVPNETVENNNLESDIEFDKVLNDFSSESSEEVNLIFNNDKHLSEQPNKTDDLSTSEVVIKLSSVKITYDKMANKIINKLEKPTLPTQEEMLDDILDTLFTDE